MCVHAHSQRAAEKAYDSRARAAVVALWQSARRAYSEEGDSDIGNSDIILVRDPGIMSESASHPFLGF